MQNYHSRVNTIKSLASIVVAGVIALAGVAPRSVLADALGISQSSDAVTIYRGDVLEETIVLTRSNTAQEQRLLVEYEGDALFDLRGQDAVVIPAGSDTGHFTFDVDASSAAAGEYEGRLLFVLDDPARADAELQGTAIRYALVAAYHVSVIERPDASVTLGVTDYPTLINDVGVSSVAVDQEFAEGGKRVKIVWTLTNDGANPLSGVESQLLITRRGMTFFQDADVAADVVPAGGMLERSTEFVLSDKYPPGRYEVTVRAGDEERRTAVWVLHKRLLWSLFALGVGVAASGVTYAIMRFGKKSSRQRSTRR